MGSASPAASAAQLCQAWIGKPCTHYAQHELPPDRGGSVVQGLWGPHLTDDTHQYRWHPKQMASLFLATFVNEGGFGSAANRVWFQSVAGISSFDAREYHRTSVELSTISAELNLVNEKAHHFTISPPGWCLEALSQDLVATEQFSNAPARVEWFLPEAEGNLVTWPQQLRDGQTGAQWFFAFMLVMVMVLLNMLVAILMEAYGVVKEDAKNADSLFQQTKNILRRAQQLKRKERVKLTDIWDALRKDVDPAFELQDFKAGLTSMVTRLDYSALCATYLSEKIRQYQEPKM
eukprot:Skav234633  [mRNA]  locus=scaffold1609:47334:56546:+ [translate_table: standard]